jgi:hypothetical protein
MRFVPVGAVLVLGLALYFTRGVLDQVLTPTGAVRVALLPPWQALGGFLALGALGLLWLDRRAIPRGTSSAVRPPLGPWLLPLFGLVLLILPYLPVLPDHLPALQMLAGPLRIVIWIAIVTQLAWVLWQARLVRADWLQRFSVRQLTVVIAVLTALTAGTAAARLTGTVLFPAGDEPHYLVIAQSLWRDGDFKIENNHTQGDYREYYARDLEPHYLTRGSDSQIYSIHPVGLPILIAPVYAAGGYRLVVLLLVVTAAIAAALMWRSVLRITNAASPATFAWAAIACTTPFLYNTFTVYPEIAAALAVVVAITLATDPGRSKRVATSLVIGLACAVLPWLSTKYAPMSAALVTIALGRIWLRSEAADDEPQRLPRSAAVLAPYALSLAAWFAFFYALWGVPLPQAPYGAMVQTRPFNLIFGAPGLLFDQEYGVLPYAPVYIVAIGGLWLMVRAGGDLRRRAIEHTLAFAALLATVGAFRIWWGGSASPGRPLASGLLLLALPMAIAFREAPAGSTRRAAHHLLLAISVTVALVMLFAQEGLLLSNGRDGTSSLLEYLSPRWPAWTLAPSFIHHEAGTAWMHSLAWIGLAAMAAVIVRRARPMWPGAASLIAIATCAGALLLAALIIPLLPADPPWPSIDARARARLPLLDDFDAVARPIGVEYSPVRPIAATEAIGRAMLMVEPGAREDAQPIRVLHNGRFTLPAGHYRVDVEWNGARSGETIGLQIGRTGNAWQSWPVEARPGERWSTEFSVPVDASFVGLRGTPELERAIARISVVALQVVNAGQRPRVGTVLAASHFGETSVFYHDTNATPEDLGFWVWGGRSTRVSIARANADAPLTVRLHSGLIHNRVTVSMFGWAHTLTLLPVQPQLLEIPSGDRRFVTLEIAAEYAFVPAALDPTSKDTRSLGAWVEILK